MERLLICLILGAGMAGGQLNFEGNPLTEDTDYTAEESHLTQRTAKQEKSLGNSFDRLTEPRKSLSPPFQEPTANTEANSSPDIPVTSLEQSDFGNVPISTERSASRDEFARNFPPNSYNPDRNSAVDAELALSTFLNSKTPEESNAALEHYLKTSGSPVQSSISHHDQVQQPQQHQFIQSVSNVPNHGQLINQQGLTPYQPNQVQQPPVHQYPIVDQQQQMPQSPSVVAGNLQPYPNVAQTNGIVGQPNGIVAQPQAVQRAVPYLPIVPNGIRPRNDFVYAGGWQRFRRVPGRPAPYLQPRLGPAIYKGPGPAPFKTSKGPVEVIYTRPPGFHRGAPPISNPPVGYEDAGAWFPDMDYPPASKDVYYSQLYAQSYDPHYYNYIAKTGKIRPHLYGKLGKHEEKDEDIWSELYRGFKKHGLKNLMTPTFLLGMTLPVVTLMLTALVQKRSLSRSDSREFHREDAIQEYLERAQRAMECYEKKRRKRDTSGVDGC